MIGYGEWDRVVERRADHRTYKDVEAALARCSFARSCVDMGWRWTVREVFFPPDRLNFKVWSAGFLIHTTFRRPDRDPPHAVAEGHGRWWHVPPDASDDGIAKTAFAAAKLVVEHELMESFRIDDFRVFDPHHTIEDLKRACASRALSPEGAASMLPIALERAIEELRSLKHEILRLNNPGLDAKPDGEAK